RTSAAGVAVPGAVRTPGPWGVWGRGPLLLPLRLPSRDRNFAHIRRRPHERVVARPLHDLVLGDADALMHLVMDQLAESALIRLAAQELLDLTRSEALHVLRIKVDGGYPCPAFERQLDVLQDQRGHHRGAAGVTRGERQAELDGGVRDPTGEAGLVQPEREDRRAIGLDLAEVVPGCRIALDAILDLHIAIERLSV